MLYMNDEGKLVIDDRPAPPIFDAMRRRKAMKREAENAERWERILEAVKVAEETAMSEIRAYGVNYEAYEQEPRWLEDEADAEEAADFEAWFRELYTAEINR